MQAVKQGHARYLAATCVLAAVLSACTSAPTPSPSSVSPTATVSPTPAPLDPADGQLRVGSSVVAQAEAVCSSQDGPRSCYFTLPDDVAQVLAKPGEALSLKAGNSTQFSLSAFNVADPSKPVTSISTAPGQLLVGKATKKGQYQLMVTGAAPDSDALSGPTGGTWLFYLEVR